VYETREGYIRHHVESCPYSSWKKNFDVLTTERVVLIKSHPSIHINLLNLLFVLTDILDDPSHVAVDIDQPDTFDAKNIVLMNMMRDLGLFKSPQAHRF
jgi:hypothetical protein